MLDRAKASVVAMLAEHRWLVEALRDALLEHDELVGHEIIETIAKATASHQEALPTI
jgi:hypothetical protein